MEIHKCECSQVQPALSTARGLMCETCGGWVVRSTDDLQTSLEITFYDGSSMVTYYPVHTEARRVFDMTVAGMRTAAALAGNPSGTAVQSATLLAAGGALGVHAYRAGLGVQYCCVPDEYDPRWKEV